MTKQIAESVTGFSPGDMESSQRNLTADEGTKLQRVSNVFLRLSLIYFSGGALISAFLIRLLTNLTQHQLNPELSGFGWLAAVFVGLVCGWGKFRLWVQMRKDIQAGMAVTVQKKGTTGQAGIVKEYLPLSKFHLVNNEEPKDWRTR